MATTDVDKIKSIPTPQQVDARARLDRLVAESGAKPLTIDQLNAMGDLWPEDDSVDDFLAWREQVRKEEKSRRLS